MDKRRSSAAYRIAFATFGAVALGLAILGAIIFAVMHIAFTRQLDTMIADGTQSLVADYRQDGPAELADAIREREASPSSTRLLYAVYAPDGRRLYGNLQAVRPPVGIGNIKFIDPGEGPDSGRVSAVDLSPRERLVVAADREWIERIDKTVVAVFGSAFLAACILGLAGALLFGAYLRRRLSSISQSAEAIIGGDVSKRMPISPRGDEFDQLASTLNRMLDRIESLLENLRQVSNDIAHDLRTPLSRLRTRLEEGVLGRANEAPEVIIEDALLRVDELIALFAAILRIAEVESGETRRFFAPVDMSAMVTELAESFAASIQDGGRLFLWSAEPGLTVDGDRKLLAQAAINLLENAQRHTPEGTMIRLTLAAAGDLVCLRVSDNGPGVPRSDFGRITKRFARLESSRTTSGYGLGLSLVSAVANLHRGRLVLSSGAPGFIATIELPAFVPNHAHDAPPAETTAAGDTDIPQTGQDEPE